MLVSLLAPPRHCEKRTDEAIQGMGSPPVLDYFAEPVLGLAEGKARGLAMTLGPPPQLQA